MAKYIDAEKLIVQIEKMKKKFSEDFIFSRDEEGAKGERLIESEIHARIKCVLCDTFIELITTLQQEQPCLPFNVDEAAENYYEQDCPYPGEARVVNNEHDVWFPSQAIEDAFIAGAQWGAEHLKK